MAKFSSIKNTFQNGELSDKLVGRTDINEYGNGCKLLQNFIPLVSGGITKLPGSRYVEDLDSAGSPDPQGDRALLPFIDLNRTPFIVELYLNESSSLNRIVIKVRDVNGQEQNLDCATDMNTIEVFSDGISKGWDWTQIGTTLFITHKSRRVPPFFVYKAGNEFFARPLNSSLIFNIPSMPNRFLRLPYQAQNLSPNLVLKTSALTGSNTTLEMLDSSAAAVKYFRGVIGPRGPAVSPSNSVTFRVNGASSSGIVTASAPCPLLDDTLVNAGTDNFNGVGHNFTTGDEVQMYEFGTLPAPLVEGVTYYVIRVDADNFKLADSAANAALGTAIDLTDTGAGNFYVVGMFTAKASGSVFLGLPSGTNTTGLSTWQRGAWNAFDGYPSVVSSFDERLLLMATFTEPDTVWNSRKGNFFHFMQSKYIQDQGSTDVTKNNYFGALDSTDAFSYLPASSEVGRISWASSQRSLYIGTDYTEFSVSRVDGIYGPPNNFSIDPQTYHGASPVRAVRQGVTSLFITRDGKRVRDFRYSDNNGSNISRNLSILADQMHAHKFVSGDYNGINFVLTAWQESASTMWLLTSLGSVVSLTLDDSGNATAWARHDFGGEVRSIVSLPSSNGDWDDVWFLVKRGSNYYLEYISEPFEHPLLVNSSNTPSDIPIYLHSAIVVTNSPASTAVSGLSHLEGEEVYCLADGVKQGPFTVASGAITLDTAAEEIVVGLQYTSKMITMPLEAGAIIGSSQNLLKRVEQVLFKLYKSLGGKYGFGDRLYDFEYGTVVSGQTFTGNLDQVLHSTNAKDYRVVVEHSDPYPFTLLSAVMRGVTQE